jgi:hypothetical protein
MQGQWPASVVIEDRNPFDLPDADAINAVISKNDYWGLRVFGFVDVPASGEYLFQISGQDGTALTGPHVCSQIRSPRSVFFFRIGAVGLCLSQ